MCLCCAHKNIGCGFQDEDFASPIWSDPESMISGGDVVGTATTESDRVTAELSFTSLGTFRLAARVEVVDGVNNWAGIEVSAVNLSADLIIESTGSGASDVIVRGHGTADKSGTDEYLIAIEYVMGLAAPIINFYVDDELVDSQTTTGTADGGTVKLTAFSSASVLSFGIVCPPSGTLQCPLWCPEGLDINGIVIDGLTDVAEYPFETRHGPFGGAIKFGSSGSCSWGRELATEGSRFGQNSFAQSVGLVLSTTQFAFRTSDTDTVVLPSGLKLIAFVSYTMPDPDLIHFLRQTGVYWKVVDSTEPFTVDCRSLNGEVLNQHLMTGDRFNPFTGVSDMIGFSDLFDAGETATLLFIP